MLKAMAGRSILFGKGGLSRTSRVVAISVSLAFTLGRGKPMPERHGR
jgi:hypothetical protein